MLPPGAVFDLKIHQNVYATGASPRTALKKLTELPDPYLVFREPFRGRGGRKGEGKGGKEEKGRVSVPPLLFFTI